MMNGADETASRSNITEELATRRDEHLVSEAQRGSSEAFEELQRIFSRRLYRTILSIIKTPEDAEDALQDTFLQSYSSLCEFKGRSKIYSWLTRIAINSALAILRKRRAHPEILFDPNGEHGDGNPHFEIEDPAPNPEQIYERRQRLGRLLGAIQNLEPSLRIALEIRMTGEYSVKEIGRQLDITEAAVKVRLHRARRRLSDLHARHNLKDQNYRGGTNNMNTATETLYTPLTITNAPVGSKPVLEKVKIANGFIPNLMAIFANDPAVLQGYVALDSAFEGGSFRPREQQLILLAASVENNCNYCIAAHSTVLKGALRTPDEIVSAVRNSTTVPDAKLNALVTLVKELVRERGYAKEMTVQNFIAAGYNKEQVMELLLGIALKTISNYLDHISPTPIDKEFAAESK